MKVKKTAIAIGSIAIIGLLGTTTAFAYRGNPEDQGPNYDAEIHNLKVDAFSSTDYEVWKDLMEQSGARGRVLEVVNEENFNAFVEAHNAAISGDYELANELRASIGLNNGQGKKDGSGYKNARGNTYKERNFIDSNNDRVCDNKRFGGR